MKVCVIGAGAVGGLIASRLTRKQADQVQVSMLARGATLQALQTNGLQCFEKSANANSKWQCTTTKVAAFDQPADIGVQDLVIISVKYNAMEQIAQQIGPLLGPETVVLSAMNGVPWWFGHGQSDQLGQLTLNTVDPNGSISAAIQPSQVIGCVVHLAASVREPGVIQLNMGNRLVLGEPDDTKSTRLSDTAALLSDAGFDVEVSESIHYDLWYKLWGNMTVNPVSAITGAETDAILADPALRIFITNAMLEAKVIAQKLDLNIGEEPEQRHQVTEKLGGFKTSMLQDVESGKPIELDALVTVVCEIARQLDVSVPNITALLGITRVFAKTNNLVTSDA